MSITKFGEWARDLRIKKSENLKSMAHNLEVSSAFLSAVENGKKKIPKNWFEKLCKLYNLVASEKEKLNEAIAKSTQRVVLNLDKTNQTNRELALIFARAFEELDDDELKQIQEILNKRKRGKNDI